MVYRGYSTTQAFYGQQLHFPMARWQGSDGDHESVKCKEFSEETGIGHRSKRNPLVPVPNPQLSTSTIYFVVPCAHWASPVIRLDDE